MVEIEVEKKSCLRRTIEYAGYFSAFLEILIQCYFLNALVRHQFYEYNRDDFKEDSVLTQEEITVFMMDVKLSWMIKSLLCIAFVLMTILFVFGIRKVSETNSFCKS